MKISKNKIVVLIAGTFCLFALAFVGMKLTKKNQSDRVGKNQEASLLSASERRSLLGCDDDFQKLDNNKLVQYVLNIPDSVGNELNSDQIRKSDYGNEVAIKSLRCQYEEAGNDQEKDKILVQVNPFFSRMFKNEQVSSADMAKETFKNPEKSFLRNIALSDFSALCPDKLPQMCAKENNVLLIEPKEWCEDVCTTLIGYKNDSEKLSQEVINLSNVETSLKDDIFAYRWRIALIYGIKGRAEALKFCDSIPENLRYACNLQINSFEIMKTDCGSLVDKLKAGLCGS